MLAADARSVFARLRYRGKSGKSSAATTRADSLFNTSDYSRKHIPGELSPEAGIIRVLHVSLVRAGLCCERRLPVGGMGEGGSFQSLWRDYKQSLSTWINAGWNDGDDPLDDYVGHPMQGAM